MQETLSHLVRNTYEYFLQHGTFKGIVMLPLFISLTVCKQKHNSEPDKVVKTSYKVKCGIFFLL